MESALERASNGYNDEVIASRFPRVRRSRPAGSSHSGLPDMEALVALARRVTGHPFARRRLIAAAAAVLLCALVIVLAVSLGGSHTNPYVRPATDAAATAQAFDDALAARDFDKICNSLFTASAREAAGGSSCAAQLSARAAGLHDIQVHTTAIQLRGDLASAMIVVHQPGQPDSSELLGLERDGSHFKVSSAGPPPEN